MTKLYRMKYAKQKRNPTRVAGLQRRETESFVAEPVFVIVVPQNAGRDIARERSTWPRIAAIVTGDPSNRCSGHLVSAIMFR